jgi:phenylalanyl-tRNA synthetase beta chain
VSVPSYRHDIVEEIDLIEEISRLLGMQPNVANKGFYTTSELPHSQDFIAAREIRQRLCAEGLQEFLTCNLISPRMVEIVKNHPIDQASLVKVMNPMSEEQSVLRPSTLPGLLDVVKRNINQRTLDVAGFEIGHVHFKKEAKFHERLVVGLVMTGKALPSHFDRAERAVDFLDLKAIVENVLTSLGIVSRHFEKAELSILHTGRQAKIISSGLQIGMMGELHPSVLRQLDIAQPVLFAEFDVQDLMSLPRKNFKFYSLPEFPASERDWTITLPEQVTYDEILSAIHQYNSPILESVALIAIFRHEKLGADRKNVTLRFVFRDLAKTISQEEVDREFAALTRTAAGSL